MNEAAALQFIDSSLAGDFRLRMSFHSFVRYFLLPSHNTRDDLPDPGRLGHQQRLFAFGEVGGKFGGLNVGRR